MSWTEEGPLPMPMVGDPGSVTVIPVLRRKPLDGLEGHGSLFY